MLRLFGFPKIFDDGLCVKPFGNQPDNFCAILITFSFPFAFKLIEYALLLFGISVLFFNLVSTCETATHVYTSIFLLAFIFKAPYCLFSPEILIIAYSLFLITDFNIQEIFFVVVLKSRLHFPS